MINSTQKLLGDARTRLILDHPFFGSLAVSAEYQESRNGETSGMGTDGKIIWYKPELIDQTPRAQLLWLLCHEVLHIGLKHNLRRGNRNPTLWNWACDFAVNGVLMDEKGIEPIGRLTDAVELPLLFSGQLDPEYHGLLTCYDRNLADKNVEQIYDILSQRMQSEMQQQQQSQQQSQSGQKTVVKMTTSGCSPDDEESDKDEDNDSEVKGGGGSGGKGKEDEGDEDSESGDGDDGEEEEDGEGDDGEGEEDDDWGDRDAEDEENEDDSGSDEDEESDSNSSPSEPDPSLEDKIKEFESRIPGSVSDATREDGSSLDADERREAEQQMDVALIQAAKAVMMAGMDPGGMARRILDSLKPAQLNWRETLRRFVRNSVNNNANWSIPNRRYLPYGVHLPSCREPGLSHIIVAIDTSGSINDSMLKAFYQELSQILGELPKISLTVIQCDNEVEDVQSLNESDLPLNIEPVGGGGTSFKPVFDHVSKELTQTPDCLIYFTDGCTSDGGDLIDPGFPVLWTLWDEEDSWGWQEMFLKSVTFGEAAYMHGSE